MSDPVSVVVAGSGGREHALAARLSAEGVRVLVTALPHDPAEAEHDIVEAIAERDADLVVIGPEAPLVDGIVDRLAARWVPVFGPSAAAARLEGSKSFARTVAAGAGVPIAEGESFEDTDAAIRFARRLGRGVVVKADGLAAGKGVTVCDTADEAEAAIRECRARFGEAARRIVVERRLEGREASVIAICDGVTAVPLPPARDHKRVGDGDTGPNTGGMGAYSPLDDLADTEAAAVVQRIHGPVLKALADRGTPFRGALYAGLMLTPDGPYVLEFNVRFGDPETQAIMPRLDVPLGRLLRASALGRLRGEIEVLGLDERPVARPLASVAVVVAAEGYPGTPRHGDTIELDRVDWPAGAMVHWGAIQVRDEPTGTTMTTDGGRVATVVGTGTTVEHAATVAYEAAARIRFPGAFYRRDIGRATTSVAGGDDRTPVGSGAR